MDNTTETKTKDETAQKNKQFIKDVVAKIKYLDFEFAVDSLNSPTDSDVAKISKDNPYFLRPIIRHYGANTDEGSDPNNKSWLTFFGYVSITEWSEEAIAKAVFVALIQKLRHEASETFKLGDDRPFHEHRTRENIEIPK